MWLATTVTPHDTRYPNDLVALIRAHADPQALADAVVGSVGGPALAGIHSSR